MDFQSIALPTELPHHISKNYPMTFHRCCVEGGDSNSPSLGFQSSTVYLSSYTATYVKTKSPRPFLGPGLSLYKVCLSHTIPEPVRLKRSTKNSTNRKCEEMVLDMVCNVFIVSFSMLHTNGSVGYKYEAKIERLLRTHKYFCVYFQINI